MDNSDPVSPKAYWLPVSLILLVQPMRAIAAVSDVGMKGQKEGGCKRQRNRGEGGKKMGMHDVGREMESDKDGDVEEKKAGESGVLCTEETKATIPEH